MNRREFLRCGPMGLAALTFGCSAADPAAKSTAEGIVEAPLGPPNGARRSDVLVIGAGIAGLVAAYRLTQRGLSVIVLEASDRVGGRMSTDVVDGYVIDRGAGFLSTTYEVLLPLIEEVGLGDRLAAVSEWSATVRAGTPRRVRSGDPNTVLSSGLLDAPDYSVLGARYWSDLPAQQGLSVNNYADWVAYDTEDSRLWSDAHYTPQITNYIVEPLMQGLYATALPGMSKAMPIAVLAHGYHQPRLRSLRDGLGSLPLRLAAQLDVRLNTPANSLAVRSTGVSCRAGTHEYSADHVVLATTSSVARRLYTQADSLEGRLMSTGYASRIMMAIGTRQHWRDRPELQQCYGLSFPEAERAPEQYAVASVGIESFKNPDSAPEGELINVYLRGNGLGLRLLDAPQSEVAAQVLKELSPYLPGIESSVRFIRTYRWHEAEPLSPIGRARDVRDYRDRGGAGKRVLLAGDYLGMPWTESAAQSALWAAEQILALR